MVKRRGYIISAVILIIDLLCFNYGGAFVAIVALIYSVGIGEYIARAKYRAVKCNPVIGNNHEKLFNCYNRVKDKIEERYHITLGIRIYLIPGEEMNAYCFGSRSIGVTEGALSLDNKTVEAIIAHELGHVFNGDSILNMIIVVNCLSIIVILAIYQFALVAFIYIIMFICCLIGLFQFSFVSYFVTRKVSSFIKSAMKVMKMIVLQINRIMISIFARKSEYEADRFAAYMGYALYLKIFLKRFAPDSDYSEQGFFSVLYDTHPSSSQRIQELNSLEEQGII